MKIRQKSRLAKVLATMLATTMAVTATSGVVGAFAANNGIAVPDPEYKTLAEAQAAAADLNVELTGEGSVLLKNKDNALPIDKNANVVVFGSAATALQGATGKVNEALTAGGFKNVNSTVVTEDIAANAEELGKVTFAAKDSSVAVIVLKRGGGEGSDLPVKTNELADDEAENDGWTHKSLGLNSEGEEVKHNQMLTAKELVMIDIAKEKCGKVVVLLNTSNAMEMYNLQNDNEIDGILWIGRPGANGIKAIPKLLSGEVNPSGKLVAEWYKDFTADPTWYNSIGNTQNAAGSDTYLLADGSTASSVPMHGVDYSEDIYIGYKYYETVYAEIAAGRLTYGADKELKKGAGTQAQADAWHADNVVYPFGYGLSYTGFEIETVGLSVGDTLSASDVSSSVGTPAKIKSIKMTVKVTNTGNKAGKEVVEIYSQAPYTVGGIEKAAVNLVGYAKTDLLAPKTSQTITLEINLQDMASYDYADANKNGFFGYELESGKYTLFAANTSHVTADTAKSEFTLDGDAKLGLDDFSDNEITNLFSAQNGRSYSIRKNNADWNGDGKIDAKDKMFTEEQVLLSRADMVGTFPKALETKIDGTPVSQISEFSATKAYAVGDKVKVTTSSTGVTGSTTVDYYEFTKAHAAGAFDSSEVRTLSGVRTGGYVVTEEFAKLMDYYAQFNLNKWDTEYAYFAPSTKYAVGDKLGVTDTKDVYEVKADADAKALAIYALGMDNTVASGDYFYSGNNIYKATAAIAPLTFIDNGEKTDGKASKAYAVGDFVQYLTTNRSSGAIQINKVKVTAAIAAGASFSTNGGGKNCQNAAANDRLVTSGDGANVESVTHADFLALIATKTADENTGSYTYSDKLFTGVLGDNAAGQTGLTDVTKEMMAGWSQMASAEAQQQAIATGDWIYFNELCGIEFNDTSVITDGKFKGMTGEQVWTKFMNQWTWNDFWTACWNGGSDGNPVVNLGIPQGGTADSPTSWNGTYTWNDNCSIASTWNIELGEKQGEITATMGLLKNGTNAENSNRDQWLNPAINFQRTPFSGRNNEYYAQDGYQAGWYAQAVVKGIQSKGVGSHLKHMFLNDQETNRNQGDLMAWVSEQAIREVYVKPFQMGIQEGGADGAMSAFARIGAVPTPVSYNMCNELVRKEWGATNFMFHPDMYSPQANVASEDLMLRTGHNHAPGGNNTTNQGTAANNTYSGRWDAEYENTLTGTKGGVYIGRDNEKTGQKKYYSNNQWYIVRYSAMIMYSEYANQAHSKNGIITSNRAPKDLYVLSGNNIVLDISFADAKKATIANYKVTSGTLPEGLTLNESTGIITGNATITSDIEITVTGTFENWIVATQKYTIKPLDVTNKTVSYIDVVGNQLRVIYSDGSVVYIDLGSMKGDKGDQGEKGEQGDQGVQGPQGPQGEKGEQGDQGIQGPQGEQGPQGPAGANGANGADGANGSDGANGGGCGGVIGATSAVIAALAVLGGAGLVLRKKKED